MLSPFGSFKSNSLSVFNIIPPVVRRDILHSESLLSNFVQGISLEEIDLKFFSQYFFTVGIPSKTIFGLDLVKFILQGKVLLNIHYYNDAILERVRLNEMISIGIPIISELPNERDIEICQDYEGIVHFIERIDEPSLNLVQSIKNYHRDYDYHKINILEENFNNIFNKYFYEL